MTKLGVKVTPLPKSIAKKQGSVLIQDARSAPSSETEGYWLAAFLLIRRGRH
jgi:hypothetical protein